MQVVLDNTEDYSARRDRLVSIMRRQDIALRLGDCDEIRKKNNAKQKKSKRIVNLDITKKRNWT